MDCIFCKIIKGEIPSYTIYEDEKVKVFMDVNPVSNGHLLIVPKEHFVTIEDIPNDILYHINDTAKKMYKVLKEKLNVDGLTVSQNNGLGQEVKHYHMHLIPRYIDEKAKIEYLDIKEDVKVIYKKIND